ncbi:helix-turn-helix transcriptional regulator [Herbaspirillum sp. 1130]|uniref:helix-turn-helix domain-containing protein n=1 Tax=Herbaspirillum sp. 1130 TaxID=2806562 RepID=UPI001AE16220|nr:helix-turn-helix transcriptional regulator [Herbaspirillum sp. 1130]MBP1317104.1 transcriptional regulator with XRE-family HTH domain [Herbaspirillum sp. 1130]
MKKKPHQKSPISAAKSLGHNIAALRKASSLTQHQLAAALGVEIETISRYENGRLNTSLDQVDIFATFFNVPVWTLFTPTDLTASFPDPVLLTKMRSLSAKHRTTLEEIIQVYYNAHITKPKKSSSPTTTPDK